MIKQKFNNKTKVSVKTERFVSRNPLLLIHKTVGFNEELKPSLSTQNFHSLAKRSKKEKWKVKNQEENLLKKELKQA